MYKNQVMVSVDTCGLSIINIHYTLPPPNEYSCLLRWLSLSVVVQVNSWVYGLSFFNELNSNSTNRGSPVKGQVQRKR